MRRKSVKKSAAKQLALPFDKHHPNESKSSNLINLNSYLHEKIQAEHSEKKTKAIQELVDSARKLRW